VVLGCICLAVALLLSVINMFTAPIIAQRQSAAANEALLEVLPNGKDFKEIEITSSYPSIVKKGWTADGGSVFQMEVIGYASGLVIMCGVDAEGKIAGVKHIASNETFGAEGELNGAYTSKKDTIDSLEMILSASASKGAPLTSQAYYDAIKAALQSALIAGGADIDTRTPEEILQDNCNAALGTTDLTFTKWFATEALVGVDKVYETDGGLVFIIGEVFVGVNSGGEIVTADVSEDNIATVNAAYTAITESTPQDVVIPEGLEKKIASIKVTTGGNYVIEAYGDGYGIKGGNQYHPASGEQIKVKICISGTGVIIDSITTYEKETPDIGGKLLKDPSFYEAYVGKTSDDYTNVENVSTVTLTSKGYKDALKNAFAAYELLTEGGNE
jgi:Na+-translocating ferredoxin:NAD+ oxidoreductase RnfG subunit